MNEKRVEEFRQVYKEELARAVAAYPDEYPWAHGDSMVVHGNINSTLFPKKTVDEVVDKMVLGLGTKSFSKDGKGIQWTLKRLGIKNTYKAINEWLEKE